MFAALEEKALNLIKSKFRVETELIDKNDELSLVVNSIFDNKIITSHKQDLLPLLDAFKKRLDVS